MYLPPYGSYTDKSLCSVILGNCSWKLKQKSLVVLVNYLDSVYLLENV